MHSLAKWDCIPYALATRLVSMKPTSRFTGLVCLSSICCLEIFLSAGCKTTPDCHWPREEAVPKASEVRDAANHGDAKAQNDMGIAFEHSHPPDYQNAQK